MVRLTPIYRLVTATVTLSNFITPTTAQNNGSDPFPYTLEISLIPLDHTALLIAFEFPYFVYLVLYFAIGVIAILKTLFVMSYFKCFSRGSKKLTVKYFSYVKFLVPAMLKGYIILFFYFIFLKNKEYSWHYYQ